MAKRSTLATLVVGLALASLDCVNPKWSSSDGPLLSTSGWSLSCIPGGVAFHNNQGLSREAPIAVGEKRLLPATVSRAAFGCPEGEDDEWFRYVEWFDSKENRGADPTIQVRLASCTTCTPLYDNRRSDGQSQPRGRALVQGATEVVLEVTGLSPGNASLTLEACVTYCGVRDTKYLTVE